MAIKIIFIFLYLVIFINFNEQSTAVSVLTTNLRANSLINTPYILILDDFYNQALLLKYIKRFTCPDLKLHNP